MQRWHLAAAVLLSVIFRSSPVVGDQKSIVKVHADQDSPNFPGLRSILSEPLDEHMDFDTFWTELMRTMRNPPTESSMKEVRVHNRSEIEFIVTRVYDGAKFQLPADVEDSRIYRAVKALSTLVEEKRNVFGMLEERGCATILRNPLRIEYWAQHVPLDVRRSGQNVRMILKGLLDAMFGDGKIEVKADQPSMDTPSANLRSVISGPLEAHTDYEGVWEKLMRALTSADLDAMAKTKTVLPLSENAFFVTSVLDGKKLRQAAAAQGAQVGTLPLLDVVTHTQVRHSKEAGGVLLEVNDNTGTLSYVVTVKLIRKPSLRLEGWGYVPTGRLVDEQLSAVVESVLDSVIKRAKQRASCAAGQPGQGQCLGPSTTPQ